MRCLCLLCARALGTEEGGADKPAPGPPAVMAAAAWQTRQAEAGVAAGGPLIKPLLCFVLVSGARRRDTEINLCCQVGRRCFAAGQPIQFAKHVIRPGNKGGDRKTMPTCVVLHSLDV